MMMLKRPGGRVSTIGRHALRIASERLLMAICCVAVCVLLAGTQASGQVNTGTLSGQVTDASGAVVGSATLIIKDDATGYERTVRSAADGDYVFPDLPIGNYTLTVSAAGFKAEKQHATISVGFHSRSDFQLQVGAADQTVEVSAGAAELSRDDASISTLVSSDTIAETPLFLRNWDDLLRTVPGVQINRYTNQSGATTAGRTGDFNVNGIHTLQNNFILDGIDNNTFSENVQELSTGGSAPVGRRDLGVQRDHESVFGGVWPCARRRGVSEHASRDKRISRYCVRVCSEPVL
jgi:hypothetical protein